MATIPEIKETVLSTENGQENHRFLIKEVTTEKDVKEFLRLPKLIYKDDPNWIQPLDKDIEFVFDRKKNKYFRHGDCTRWIMYDENGRLIGRVAAFYNERTVHKNNDQPTGGMGFFECINDRSAAFALFDRCKTWLQERGMEAMDGPINFGERNRWWGLLVDGFTEPTYCMNYNPPYYKDLFEAYGFREYYKQFTYGLKVNEPRPEKYYRKAKVLMKDPDYHFEHVKKNNLKKYALDFLHVYNKAWGKHPGFRPMTKEQAFAMMESMKPIIVDYLIWFAYYKDEPIAIFLMLPEINQYIKHVNGKLNWIGKLKFLYHQWRGTCRKIFGAIFGVIPEFQGKGVEGAIIIAANEVVQPKGRWDEIELVWIGDFNPKMMRVAENLNARIVKTHVTYRKLFDESKPFKRHPIIA